MLMFAGTLNATDLTQYESQCKDIGFKPKTQAYGECVLELKKRDGGGSSSSTVKNNISAPVNSALAQGDGTTEDKTCRQYGFNLGTEEYSQCRLQINLAKRQFEAQQAQYEQQQRQYQFQQQQYQAQVAAAEEEKEKRKNLKLMELGLRMMGGQPVGDAAMATAGMAPISRPIAPSRPAFENYTVTLPGNRTSYCSYDTTLHAMYCR
jgi:hypothetical protein